MYSGSEKDVPKKRELEKTVDKLVIQIIPSAIEENIKKYP